jgi:hypothetical protein
MQYGHDPAQYLRYNFEARAVFYTFEQQFYSL